MAGPSENPNVASGSASDIACRQHIMVVNDTQEILDLFQDLLEEEGYRVSLYSFAFQDLAEVKQSKPDLVILDFIIGGEAQGWQLLQKMKMDRETMSIPVIVCTAAIALVRELEGRLRDKNVGIILKPFDIDDLLLEVSRVLAEASSQGPEDASGQTLGI